MQTQVHASSVSFLVQPGGNLTGTFRVPGDKSISHRAVMLGAIAEGVTHVTGFLEGEDSLATMEIFKSMGVRIDAGKPGELTIHGVGKHGLQAPDHALDCGNSGTTMRILCGLLSGMPFKTQLVGDVSLMKRPMKRVAEPLSMMNAHIETEENGCPPVCIYPVKQLSAMDYTLPVPSAQVKSAVLLAGLYADGITRVTEPVTTRDHTERMLQTFGCRVERNNNQISVSGNSVLKGAEVCVPSDISSAAFFLVGATIAPDSDLLLEGVGVNPTRSGIIEILNAMGADICLENCKMVGGEQIANIRIQSANLTGINIPEHLVPLAIDEFPAIFVAAACAEGETILRGAKELRVKESDRIETMAEGLRTLGVEVETYSDGIRIVGRPSLLGGRVKSYHDHRIAMSFAMAALRSTAPVEIEGCEVVPTSFPGFVALANQAGLKVEERSI